ncbi:MAG TPA: CPBP family glutamic-type intramembrane protease [Polyangiaceae bacterium]
MTDSQPSEPSTALRDGSGPWADLGLTLPVFVGYHLGVVSLPVRNAADPVTRELVALAQNDLTSYAALTLAIGAVYVGILVVLGRGHALRLGRFVMIALESVVYAVAMRLVAGYVVGELFLGRVPGSAFGGLVLSLGAGFYEEVAFRVVLYGLGARLLVLMFPLPFPLAPALIKLGWAVVAAAVFSGWHYVGALGDPFDAKSFVFRWVCGLVFTVIYVFRGFAPVVWTHAIYDIWVLVL